MAEEDGQQPEDNEPNSGARRRRTGVIGSNGQIGNSYPMPEPNGHALGEEVLASELPYRTCTEYVQHLNVWILQTMHYNWFALNYPLMVSSMASMQSQPQQNGLNPLIANNNNLMFNPINATNTGPQSGQSAPESVGFNWRYFLFIIISFLVIIDYILKP